MRFFILEFLIGTITISHIFGEMTTLHRLIYTLLKKNWGQLEERKPTNWKRGTLFVAGILLLGFYDGFFGPGTGSFIMLIFLILGEVVFTYRLIMGVSMIAGAFFGTKFALSKGTSFVRILFIIMTVILIDYIFS